MQRRRDFARYDWAHACSAPKRLRSPRWRRCRPCGVTSRIISRAIWCRSARVASRGALISNREEKESEAAPGGGAPARRQRLSSQDRFIDWFQSVTPYIHAFRGKIFVIAFGGDLVAD